MLKGIDSHGFLCDLDECITSISTHPEFPATWEDVCFDVQERLQQLRYKLVANGGIEIESTVGVSIR